MMQIWRAKFKHTLNQRSFMPPSHEASSIAALLIQRCATTTSIGKARQLHALILTSTPIYAKSPYVFNNIISMYARCGSMKDSQLVFDKMHRRNIISYNSLISTYSRSAQHANLGFELLIQLENEGLRPKASTFTSLLQAASSLENELLGSMLHGRCVKFGVLDDVCVHTALLGMYSNFGNLDFAKKVFRLMRISDAMAWDFVIYGCIKNGEIIEGLGIFCSMRRNGAWPNHFTYAMVLNGCSRLEDYGIGQVVHAQMIVSGTCIDLRLHNALLDMYCSCSDTQAAHSVFRKIESPDLVSWNTMLAGFAENGEGEKAMSMFVQLEQLCSAKPDEYSFAAVISATGNFPASEYGKPLHAQIEKAGLRRSVYVGSTLISMYFNNGESKSAEKIFGSILRKDVVLWTDMIAGNCRIGDTESAIRLFNEMLQKGHKTDSFALSCVLSACADLAILRQGEMIHCLAIKAGYETEMTVCGSLIDMYSKSGELRSAESIFSHVTRPDLRCWNSILGGYGHHGKAKEAFKEFDEILKHNLKPDHVTFISLLAACSHCGMVDEGKLIWDCMKEFGLKPGPKHYSCMISLLSRAGLLEEAEVMINESPFCNDYLELWRTLLSSCVIKENLGIGIRAAEHILSIDPEDSATNVLLTNLYAATGRWHGVAEIRRKIRGSLLDKDPGLSWIEVMHNIHVFSSGDQTHPHADEMKAELHRLLGNLMQPEAGEIDI